MQLLERPGPAVARNLGFFDKVREKIGKAVDDRQANMQDRSFREQIEMVADCKDASMPTFLAHLDGIAAKAGATGWRSKLPFGDEKTVNELRAVLAIFKELTPEEVAEPWRIDLLAKKRISRKTGKTFKAIKDAFMQYAIFKVQHAWLVKRKARGLPLPNTQQEMEKLLMDNPPDNIYLLRRYWKQPRTRVRRVTNAKNK